MKTVIMAGGKGTRIAGIASDIPKPLIRIADKPILQYQIECLARNGLTDITIVTGHLGKFIKECFKDGGKFGADISYFEETEPLGTAGALVKMQKDLPPDFILLCGDIIFDIDFSRFIKFHKEKNALATLLSHPNSHPYDSSLLVTSKDGRVLSWLNKEDNRLYYKNEVNAGIHVIKKELFEKMNFQKEKIDLDRDVLKPSITSQRVFAYSSPEYVKDMGTPDRYEQVLADLKNGLVTRKNLSQKQRAVFLDRDGTLNKACGFVHSAEDFILIEGSAEAVKRINNSGYLAILITNQPVIARGEISIEELENIHRKMETELGKNGAYLDGIYYCPHHPEGGFKGERPEYKIECGCRKPKPGMIFAAAEKYNIDIANSWMAGDSWRDTQCAISAGCKPAFILGTEKDSEAGVPVYKSLYDFIEAVL